jgi:hypothetical protein
MMCIPQHRAAAEEIRNLIATFSEQPQAAWLTHDAGRLPGFARALHQHVTEQTSVRVLHVEATSAAVANMIERWELGQLPRTHLDTVIALPARADAKLPTTNRNPQQPSHR